MRRIRRFSCTVYTDKYFNDNNNNNIIVTRPSGFQNK